MNRSIFLLLASLAILLVGHGMQLSLLPLYARGLGWSDWMIGLTGASYFAGFVSGCFLIPSLLNKAGYIRVFLCAAAVVAGVLLLVASSTSVVAWAVLRFVSGLSLVAIYSTAEAWINGHADSSNRGKMLSIYVIVTLLGIAAGQPVLAVLAPEDQFMVASIIILVSVLPIGLFAAEEPLQMESKSISFATIRSMPVLVIGGVFLAGIVVGLIWTMAPLVGESASLSSIEIAWMMNALIFGGIVSQYPLGYLVDRFEGRSVIGAVAAVCAGISLLLVFLPLSSTGFIIAMFFFGGSSLTLYALCSVEANGITVISRIEIAGVLLLSHGLGSVLGPLLVGVASVVFNNAMFVVCALAMVALVGVTLIVRDRQAAEVVQLHPELNAHLVTNVNLEKVA